MRVHFVHVRSGERRRHDALPGSFLPGTECVDESQQRRSKVLVD